MKCGSRIFFLFECLFFLMATSGIAKSLYVSPNGNDAVSYSNNNINNPWKTVGRAWPSALPGDTVFFRAGTYVISSVINLTNNGTAAQPIVIMNYASENVLFDAQVRKAIELQADYHRVIGISFRYNATAIVTGSSKGGNYFTISNFTAIATTGWKDNSGFIKAQAGKTGALRSSNILIENGVIIGPGTNANSNNACIYATKVTGLQVRNNVLSNAPKGIYFKHTNPKSDFNTVIANNFIFNTIRSISSVADNALIENNIVLNKMVFGDDGGSGPDGNIGGDRNIISHNTFFNSEMIFLQHPDSPSSDNGDQDNTVINNLFMKENFYMRYSGDTPLRIKSDYNLYPAGNIVTHKGNQYNLAGFQSYLGGCNQPDNDCNSTSGSPVFVGGSAPSQISDFALTPASPGYQAASDGKDIGADVSQVGVRNGVRTSPKVPGKMSISK